MWVVTATWGEYEDRGWDLIGVYSNEALAQIAEDKARLKYGEAATDVLELDEEKVYAPNPN